MASNTTTLYISDVNVSLMVTRGKRIIKLAEMPLDININEIDSPEKEARLVEKIIYLFTSNRISTRKIVLGISGMHCMTRPINLPELPKAMIAEAVIREARRILPVPVEQLYISWQSVYTTEGKLQAFLVAIPRNIADTVLRVIDKAGFKPYLMDIKPLAIARLSKEPNAIIVDVQTSEFDIIIMMHGIPQPIRTVPFPRETTDLKERLTIVKDELERTVQFYNSNNPAKIEPGFTLLVSGEIAEEPEIYKILSQTLQLKASPLISPLKCLKQLDPSHHLINVGLSLKESLRENIALKPNINTLPAPYMPKQISFNKLMALPAAAVAVGLLVMLGTTVRGAAANIEQTKIGLSSNQMLYDKKMAQKKDLSNQIAAMQAKLTGLDAQRSSYAFALSDMTNTGNKMNYDLNAAVDNVVQDLDLKTLNISGDTVAVTGRAGSEQEMFQYIRSLTATGRFKEITITNLTSVVDASENDSMAVDYSLAMTLKTGKK
jgi:type IV pilus assembly protein PilM